MNKTLASVITIIPIGICLGIYCLVYTWYLNNNMNGCMNHYKDYNYCKSIVEEGK